jgi:hypothetical protein
MAIGDYAQALGAAQQLVPDWAQEELRRKLGTLQTRSLSLNNQAQEDDIRRANLAERSAVEAQGRARTREQQIAADLAAFNAAPDSASAVRLMTTYPELRDPIKEAWGLRSAEAQRQQLADLSQIKAALAGGRADLAERILQRHIDVDLDSEDDELMLDLIRSDPTRAAAQIDGLIAAIAGPEKVGETAKALGDTAKTLGDNARADELQPGLVRKGAAEASQAETTAAYAPQVIESGLQTDEARRRDIDSQIATRASQLDIARDTLESTVNLKLEELTAAGLKPDPGSVKIMNDAVVAGSANTALAQQTRMLADEFAASDARGGFFSGFSEFAKKKTGWQDPVSLLRGRYAQLVNSAAIKSLPPGPASDRDIQIAREGFPAASAPREYIVSWLRGMAKMQDAAANWDNGRAEWVAGNGNLGTAKRDLLVNGVQVPRGTSFVDFQRRSTANTNRQAIPPRSYMEFAR